MSEMGLFRKEDLSLISYIKEVVLSGFIEHETSIPLQFMAEISDIDNNSYVYEALTEMAPSPNERGRGWVYFDCVSGTNDEEAKREEARRKGKYYECYDTVSGTDFKGTTITGTREQSRRITVYENEVLLSDSEYMIDYIDCRIITEKELNNPTVTYDWYYVSCVDEWAVIEASEPPVVVVDIHGVDKVGYQLGGGKRSIRKVDVHIFASNSAERNDIVEILYDNLYLGSCMLQDFPNGTPLDYDGTFYGRRDQETPNKLTYLYNRARIQNTSRLQFEKVVARHIDLPLLMTRGRNEVFLSDLNAYRSKISFDMILYDNRNVGGT
jgi:hypothetical protein